MDHNGEQHRNQNDKGGQRFQKHAQEKKHSLNEEKNDILVLRNAEKDIGQPLRSLLDGKDFSK